MNLNQKLCSMQVMDQSIVFSSVQCVVVVVVLPYF